MQNENPTTKCSFENLLIAYKIKSNVHVQLPKYCENDLKSWKYGKVEKAHINWA